MLKQNHCWDISIGKDKTRKKYETKKYNNNTNFMIHLLVNVFHKLLSIAHICIDSYLTQNDSSIMFLKTTCTIRSA
jgi:hypothetical protein